MALIECTECGHKVSDKAETCPSCGYKVSDIKKDMSNFVYCKINGENVNVTKIREHLLPLSKSELKDYQVVLRADVDEEIAFDVMDDFERAGKEPLYDAAVELCETAYEIIDLDYLDLSMFLVEFIANNMEPIEFNGKPRQDIEKPMSVPIPKCPTCSSTNIRNIRFFEDSMYSRKTFVCNNCGYKW